MRHIRNPTRKYLSGVALALLWLSGCANAEDKNHYVIASTGTMIGIEISQKPDTQTPQFKLGYNRAELAIVPTDRNTCATDSRAGTSRVECEGSGKASDVPDVLMELRYKGETKNGVDTGIYQRLAIGKNAVEQPGASLLFVDKDNQKEVAGAFGIYSSSVEKQMQIADEIEVCYEKISDTNIKKEIWEHGKKLNVYPSFMAGGDPIPAFQDDPNPDEFYLEEIKHPVGGSSVREANLAKHKNFVCAHVP